MDLVSYQPDVERYVNQADLTALPGWEAGRPGQITPLAQGEYNMNYLLAQGPHRWVLRVNLGTQIGRDDQITYEFGALRLLAHSGVTPRPYYLDDTRTGLPHGVLIMAYLPGEPLDYRRDLEQAAALFARLHTLDVDAAQNRLIVEERPLTAMYEECRQLLEVYLTYDGADPEARTILSEMLAWAAEARSTERYYLEHPYRCVINTEVNSGNFIVDRSRQQIHLVDWEKPLWGDPSQDLSHFSVPTTTLWKTDYRMTPPDRDRFLDAYCRAVPHAALRDTVHERVQLRDPFNCLRGVSWSAMAWVQYQTGDHVLANADTFRTMQTYLTPSFLRDLFSPYLSAR